MTKLFNSSLKVHNCLDTPALRIGSDPDPTLVDEDGSIIFSSKFKEALKKPMVEISHEILLNEEESKR